MTRLPFFPRWVGAIALHFAITTRAWPESRRRSPCGCGWSSSRNRRGGTGTELITQTSWVPTWSTATSPKQSPPERFFMDSRWSACSMRTE